MHNTIPKLSPLYTKWHPMWLWLGLGCEIYPVPAQTVTYRSLSDPGWIKQIKKRGNFLPVFTCWALGTLCIPPGCQWEFSHQWSSDHHSMPFDYLVSTTPHPFSCCFSVSITHQVPLCHCPVLSYFLECTISASPWLMSLHLFKCVLPLFCHLDSPTHSKTANELLYPI